MLNSKNKIYVFISFILQFYISSIKSVNELNI